MMYKIKINNQNKLIETTSDKSLLDILIENDIFIENPCNGNGTCGKCKIKIKSGYIPPASKNELNVLTSDEIKQGIRLSCLLFPKSHMEIELFEEEQNHNILTDGYLPKFDYFPALKKKTVKIESPSLTNQTSFENRLKSAFNICVIDWKILKNVSGTEEEVTGIFYDEALIGLENGNTERALFGVSIDIGTTTLASSLVDINTGDILANSSMINSQKKFGFDVLTRITYAMENIENGANDLQNAIVNDINTMISSMCQNIGISENQIYEVTIAGNSTMIHLLLGISSLSIGKSPYAPIFTSSKNILASDIGINIFSGGRIYCLPSVSSYIGADIISGIYVCQLDKIHGKTLFIDIGTNGEIVLSDNGKITSCSCAAGPALEGMNISCGMRASDRAIEDILINESGIEIKVIGNKKARGFCGSGILAAVKEILRTGLIRNDGRFIKKEILEKDDYRNKLLQLNNKKREFILQNDSESLIITQKDIRQIQLAKGAILSGFHALLNHMNLEINKLDKVIIAGQFGSHLPAESLIGCGILPEEIRYKLDYVGNSSKTGAYMALMSKNAKKEMENLSHEISYMELGASSGYERLFADCLIFPKVIK